MLFVVNSDFGGSGGWRNGHPPKPPIVPYLSAFITQALKPQYTCFFFPTGREMLLRLDAVNSVELN